MADNTVCHLQDRSAQDLWNAVFVTAREVLGLWGVGASYILTGLFEQSSICAYNQSTL